MNKKMFKLIWFGFPLTKIVYAFLAYSNRKEINNSFEDAAWTYYLHSQHYTFQKDLSEKLL